VDPYGADARPLDVREAEVFDCAAPGAFTPDLVEHGFARADLSGDAPLQATLERVRASGRLEASDVAAIRRRLVRRSLALGDGRRARVLFIAPEGFLLRTPGPNGMRAGTGQGAPGTEGLDGARAAHADQDVTGTPLRQLLRGAAPWIFHHESPDRRNALSPLFLLNLWIPLEQVTRPLALMDRRTLDRRRHQARFGLKVDTLLGRDEKRAVNHVWSFLHDPAHRWYFDSEMGPTTAWAFETLATPHVSFVLPGEDLAEARYRALDDARAALDARDAAALARAAARERPEPGDGVTIPLRRAIAEMDALLDEGAERAQALCRGDDEADWRERARRARQRVVRKSIELRAVCLVTRGRSPFRRG
jgi:hypothetical protein